MAHYACITENRRSSHVTQHEAQNPEEAIRLHVAALPYDDGGDYFDEELDWLQNVAKGSGPVSILPLTHCKSTWLWQEGARFSAQYLTYVVKTDTTVA